MGEEGLPPLRIWSSLAKLDTVKRWKNLVVLSLHDKHYFYYFRLLSFVVTSLGLARNKFDGGNNVQERSNPKAVCLGLCEVLFTNIPFLVLRIYVWMDCGYEASIFIAKNILSLVIGFVEFGIASGSCTC